MKAIALILIDPGQGRLGHTARLDETLAGRGVLQHTVNRAARITGIDEVVLAVRDGGAGDAALPCEVPPGVKHRTIAWSLQPDEQTHADAIAAARQWSATCWRGGIAGMSIYDELLPAGPVSRLMAQCHADAAVVVRGDWCCFDPALAGEQLKVHRSAPESLRLVFSQAPPGLGALVVDRMVADDLAQHRSTIAQLLCYNPKKPALDPISRDVCVAVPAAVRDRHRRFIYDTPRSQAHLRAIAERLGTKFDDADAETLAAGSLAIDRKNPTAQLDRLPPHLTLELTPNRPATGPITPQYHLDLPREPMGTALAIDLVQQIGEQGDSVILLGGLGDALLHDSWLGIVRAARDAGVRGIGIETDLLCDADTIAKLSDAPVDVLSVRINADSAAVYEQLMGRDGFKTVMDNLQALMTGDGRFSRGAHQRGWVVPRLVKVADNLTDMETFFERWTQLAGWAVIDRFETGQGLIADQGPVPMQPPRPPGFAPPIERQKQRLTILSDGGVTLCARRTGWDGPSSATSRRRRCMGSGTARPTPTMHGPGKILPNKRSVHAAKTG
ncbi:hypothetical protein OT109_09255 [Phycisphaeraceae bacterium D3-23]